MPKLNKNDAADVVELEGYRGAFGELGNYTVAFESYSADTDLADLFRGLPDDRCQCPHWGIVLKGKLKYTSAGEEIVVEAGEAYYVAPGHLPYMYAGTEVVEFSPTKELHETLAVIEKNLAESAS
jgi:hypothetical protein